MDLLDRMLGHDHWATGQMLELSRDLTDAQLDQSFDIGMGTLRDSFAHLVGAINFWTRQMAGEAIGEGHSGTLSIPELIALHDRNHAMFAEVARRARDEQRLDETFVDHASNRQSLGGTIVHVLNHSALHRGEARHILERLGVPDLWDYDPQEWEHATHRIQA